MALADFRFTRQERLKSPIVISALFKGGQSYVAYPMRVVWNPLPPAPEQPPVQVVFSVPKKSFKTAVARNLLKRRMREAYRLHKQALYERLGPTHPPVALMLMYIAKETLSYAEIEAGMLKMIRKFPASAAAP